MQKISCEQLKEELKDLIEHVINFKLLFDRQEITFDNIGELSIAKNKATELRDRVIMADEYLISRDLVDILIESGVSKDALEAKAWMEEYSIEIDKRQRRLVAQGDIPAVLPTIRLPDNFIVKGKLSLAASQIKELPDNLSVGNNLYLFSTDIKELPDNLSVGGDLIVNEGLEKQAEKLKKQGRIKGEVIVM